LLNNLLQIIKNQLCYIYWVFLEAEAILIFFVHYQKLGGTANCYFGGIIYEKISIFSVDGTTDMAAIGSSRLYLAN
jgi:hypothetical protein